MLEFKLDYQTKMDVKRPDAFLHIYIQFQDALSSSSGDGDTKKQNYAILAYTTALQIDHPVHLYNTSDLKGSRLSPIQKKNQKEKKNERKKRREANIGKGRKERK